MIKRLILLIIIYLKIKENIIKYKFKKLLNSTNFMFYDWNSLSSLDLSNFNTQNVINMHSMFYNCNSLSSLDLSIINMEDIEDIFYDCNSLIFKIISHFSNN